MKRLEHFRVGSGKAFLSEDELQRLPSVNATSKISTASRQYNQFNTRHIVDVLAKENWFPVFAQEQNARGERVGFQKHFLRFQQPGLVMKNVGDVVPELDLTNAHDTLSAYILMAGAFKLACSNGLIVCQAQFESIHIRHVGYEERDVIEATQKIAKEIPLLSERIQSYQDVVLKPEERELFAEEALMIKFRVNEIQRSAVNSSHAVIEDRSFSIPHLLEAKRYEDKVPTLWNTFNIVQEKLTKGGGFERTTRMTPHHRMTRVTQVREVGAINENIRINQELWALMAMFLTMKTARA